MWGCLKNFNCFDVAIKDLNVSKDPDDVSETLLSHIAKIIQLEHGVKIDGNNYIVMKMDGSRSDSAAIMRYLSREVSGIMIQHHYVPKSMGIFRVCLLFCRRAIRFVRSFIKISIEA